MPSILTKINVYKYATVATGRPIAAVPSGTDLSWFTLIPISNRTRASHCSKIKTNQAHGFNHFANKNQSKINKSFINMSSPQSI